MKKLLVILMLAVSLSVSAAVGDTTPIASDKIVEVKSEQVTNSKGKTRTEHIVIYKDAQGNRRMAYMTATDHKKLEQAKRYNLYVEYVLVEGKTRNKITIK